MSATPTGPRVESSDPLLTEMFAWASRTARSFVQPAGRTGPVNVDEHRPQGSGTGVYLPCYWAGYRHRSGFYARDFAHQALGAHLLGLHTENATMLRAFARSATPEHGHYPVWAFNFDGSYLAIDYRGPDEFVREVPAVFELVETAELLHRWTADRSLIEDPVLWDFYTNSVTAFVEQHAASSLVARGNGRGIFHGIAGYVEREAEPMAEAGDGIATQYRAYLAAAALCRAKGDMATAAGLDYRGWWLKRHFNDTWSHRPGKAAGNAPAGMVYGYTLDGTPLTGWGQESGMFMPLKGIIDHGPRNNAYLDHLDASARGTHRAANIESLTYLPDLFLAHGRSDAAWFWMREIYSARHEPHEVPAQGTNGDYPEVSFTLVAQTIAGLLGLQPDGPSGTLATQSRLPAEIDWLTVSDIPVGPGTVTVHHTGHSLTTLTNQTGDTTLTWEARFPGTHTRLIADGRTHGATTRLENGTAYSFTTVPVPPGGTRTVRTPV